MSTLELVKLKFSPERMQASYVRTRHKNIRCFPQCCGIHNERSFCGDSLLVIAEGDQTEEDIHVIGEFRNVEHVRSLKLGDQVSPSQMDNFIISTLVIHQPTGTRFSFNPPRKWEHKAKAKPTQNHIFTAYCVRDGTVVGVADTTPFQLIPIWKNVKHAVEVEDDGEEEEMSTMRCDSSLPLSIHPSPIQAIRRMSERENSSSSLLGGMGSASSSSQTFHETSISPLVPAAKFTVPDIPHPPAVGSTSFAPSSLLRPHQQSAIGSLTSGEGGPRVGPSYSTQDMSHYPVQHQCHPPSLSSSALPPPQLPPFPHSRQSSSFSSVFAPPPTMALRFSAPSHQKVGSSLQSQLQQMRSSCAMTMNPFSSQMSAVGFQQQSLPIPAPPFTYPTTSALVPTGFQYSLQPPRPLLVSTDALGAQTSVAFPHSQTTHPPSGQSQFGVQSPLNPLAVPMHRMQHIPPSAFIAFPGEYPHSQQQHEFPASSSATPYMFAFSRPDQQGVAQNEGHLAHPFCAPSSVAVAFVQQNQELPSKRLGEQTQVQADVMDPSNGLRQQGLRQQGLRQQGLRQQGSFSDFQADQEFATSLGAKVEYLQPMTGSAAMLIGVASGGHTPRSQPTVPGKLRRTMDKKRRKRLCEAVSADDEDDDDDDAESAEESNKRSSLRLYNGKLR